jgi:uncharacterized membrane protein
VDLLSEIVRGTALLLGAWLAVSMLLIGIKLRNTRQWGCYCVTLFAAAVVYGNATRLHQPITVGTILATAATFCGLVYTTKVRDDWVRNDWVRNGR